MTEKMQLSELYRYPVKSVLGTVCTQVSVNARGVLGDRLYAILDADGRIGSHKNTRRFIKLEGLFSLQVGLDGDTPTITFPSGETIAFGDARMDAALCAHTGANVALCKESDASFMDDAPLHLVSTASLAWLKSCLPGVGVDARRFRPNFVIEATGDAHHEQSWHGKRMVIGDCEIEITGPTERCVMTTLAQQDLERAPAVLKTVANEDGVNFGVYAKVIKPGTVSKGDAVRFL